MHATCFATGGTVAHVGRQLFADELSSCNTPGAHSSRRPCTSRPPRCTTTFECKINGSYTGAHFCCTWLHSAHTGVTLGAENNMKIEVWQDRLAPVSGASSSSNCCVPAAWIRNHRPVSPQRCRFDSARTLVGGRFTETTTGGGRSGRRTTRGSFISNRRVDQQLEALDDRCRTAAWQRDAFSVGRDRSVSSRSSHRSQRGFSAESGEVGDGGIATVLVTTIVVRLTDRRHLQVGAESVLRKRAPTPQSICQQGRTAFN